MLNFLSFRITEIHLSYLLFAFFCSTILRWEKDEHNSNFLEVERNRRKYIAVKYILSLFFPLTDFLILECFCIFNQLIVITSGELYVFILLALVFFFFHLLFSYKLSCLHNTQ